MTTKKEIQETIPVEKKTWKTINTLPVNLEKLQSLQSMEKIAYLALCGWRMEVELRNEIEYIYAIRYIDRKKRRIYIARKDSLNLDL
jgi:hypothetical protein